MVEGSLTNVEKEKPAVKVEGKAPAKPEGKEADKGDKANKGRNSEGSMNLCYFMIVFC